MMNSLTNPENVIQLTRQLVDIPSVTGEEAQVANFLAGLLEVEGWKCTRQAVEGRRFNLLATRSAPRFLLTTHLDTVPPFFPSEEDEHFVYGRGSCDAKGIAAAMIGAASQLCEGGELEVGLLFVVGEETDSSGAKKARELELSVDFVIDGEPTDNELVHGHKGMLFLRLVCTGRSAHSSHPEMGESAVNKLVDILLDLRSIELPEDEQLGRSLINVAMISGGRAPNVIPDEAWAEVTIRTVVSGSRYLEIVEEVVGDRARIEGVRVAEPQRMLKLQGWASRAVGFCTDIPYLREIGTPLLIGPGSILEAHTARERVAKRELIRSVDLYQRLIRSLKKHSAESAGD